MGLVSKERKLTMNDDQYRLILRALVYLITRAPHNAYGYDDMGNKLIIELQGAIIASQGREEDSNEKT